MATQTLEIDYVPGQALTAKLFAIGSDIVVQTASSVTEAANRSGRYQAAFTDAPAGDYMMRMFLAGAGASSDCYTLTLTTGVFQPWSETGHAIDSSGVTTLLTRVTALLQTKTQADTDQAATIAAIAGISGGATGSGSVEKEITITSGGQPVDGAAVWITTDIGGTNVVAGTLYTDEFGNVTFMLDATGVGEFYYCWKQRAGVNFTNPESFTVA